MGVVYKAEDTKLKRTVALKFLSPQSLGSKGEQSRFIHEAQAAAALDHSNICTVYEINEAEGKSFIAMAYVDGPSLKEEVESGRLAVDRAVDIAIQVADGLRVAHGKGIVHRDIKSANIMLTSEGQAKITDFGLAKLPGRTKLTRTGSTVGTLAYMSPEQAQGAEVDHRSDIWSLGVVLYELVSGQVPFKGDHEAAMVYSIMNQDVAPLRDRRAEVPAELDSIVAKMLQKNPNNRYASAEELLSDLRKVQAGVAVKVALPMSRKAKRMAWGLFAVVVVAAVVSSVIILNRGPATVNAKTLAVVDFDIISGEEAEHLAVGLSEGISVKLSKLAGVRVVSSDDIRRLRKKDLSAKEVASQLGAQYALGGSLFRSGEKIRVTPQLIDAATGDVIWSELFDREFSDVFGFLDEISLKIVAALELELEPEERVALEEKPTESAEAYEHYLKGRNFYYRVTFKDNELSAKEFQKALQTDADYPLALAGLADAYVQRYSERYDYDEFWLDEADSLIGKALGLDPNLAEAYESRAEVLFEKENYLAALEAAERAKSLQPDLDEPYVRLGEIYEKRGEFRKALEMFDSALRLRPSVDALCGRGNVFQIQGQLDSAEVTYRKAIELNPDHERPYWALGTLSRELDNIDEAEKLYRRAIEVRPDFAPAYSSLKSALTNQNRDKEAEELLWDFVDKYPYNWDAYETLYGYLAWRKGDFAACLEVLKQAVSRNPDRVWPRLLLAHHYAYQLVPDAKPEEAIKAVQKAVALRPGSGRVLRWAGDVYADLDSAETAVGYYEHALEANPGSATVLGSIAKLLFARGLYDSVVTVTMQAVGQSPGVTGDWLWGYGNYNRLGEAMAHLQRTEEYLDFYANAVDEYGKDNPKLLARLGFQQCLSGKYRDAIDSYQRSLELKRDDWALAGLGTAQWLAGDTEAGLDTIRESEKMWQLVPILKYLGRFDEIEAWLDDLRGTYLLDQWGWVAGLYYASMRRYNDALAVVDTVRASDRTIYPDHLADMEIEFYRRRGDLAMAKQLLTQAETWFPAYMHAGIHDHRAFIAAIEGNLERALDLVEDNAFRARMQFANGQREEAMATLEKASDGITNFRTAEAVSILYYRGQLDMMSGFEHAEDHLKKARQFAARTARHVQPWRDRGKARCLCALASARLGDSARSRDEIKFAVRLEPERADIAYYAACVFSLLGENESALQWLETAVERGHQELWWARVDPDLDALRKLPRFKEIMDEWDRRIEALIH